MFTERQKLLVQGSWQSVVPIADQAAQLFYSRLFTLDPELRHLFHRSSMEEQGRKLIQMLTVVVKGLDDPDRLLPAVRSLGERHAGYRVNDAHYDTVAEALLWTLEQGLGEAFTAEVRSAWTVAYALLASVMKEASARATSKAA